MAAPEPVKVTAGIKRANRACEGSVLPALFLLHLGPGVLQCNRAVEHRRAWLLIRIGTEVADTLELIPAARRGIR